MILPGNIARTLPIIEYDEVKCNILIKGKSVSVEVDEYWDEFIPYFKDCLTKEPRDINLRIELEYFNTKTSKILYNLFVIIKKLIIDNGFKANIVWVVEEGDEDTEDAVGDYVTLTKLDINIEYIPEKR